MKAIQLAADRIDSDHANAIDTLVRRKPRAVRRMKVGHRRAVERDHRDIVSSFDEAIRHGLQKTLAPTHQRGIRGGDVNDSERPSPVRCMLHEVALTETCWTPAWSGEDADDLAGGVAAR